MRGETGSGGSRSLVKMEFCQEIERTRKLPARFDRPWQFCPKSVESLINLNKKDKAMRGPSETFW